MQIEPRFLIGACKIGFTSRLEKKVQNIHDHMHSI